MKKIQRLLGVPLLLAAAALSVACDGAGPAGPMVDLDNQLMGAQAKRGIVEAVVTDDSGAVVHEILNRAVPLPNDVSASRVIGKAGGMILSFGGGFGLWVPEGALNKDVEITVTALAGDKLAFDFQPHGLRFREPVTVGILKGIGYSEEGAMGVYYEGDPRNNPKILEFFRVFDSGSFTVLETTHFSGYALASGSRSQKTMTGASY